MNRQRRRLLQALAATGLLGRLPQVQATCACSEAGRVVIVGGGFAGATCAKYLRYLNPQIEVILIEPKQDYYTCPFSNLVLAGMRALPSLRQSYTALSKNYGIQVIHASVTAIEADVRLIQVNNEAWLAYDRLVVAPGISMLWNAPEGYDESAAEHMPHAWAAGAQTRLLSDQLQAMPENGVVAISVPPRPFRCPPGPYERACLIAHYLKQHKPRAKLLLLDANETFSKQDVFEEAWSVLYPGMIERIGVSGYGGVTRVDARSNTLFTETDRYKVNVANVIPSQQAGQIAVQSGLVDESGWCPIDPSTFKSILAPDIHVLGDACIADPIPKSATAANSQAKFAALVIAAELAGETPPLPSLHNTCYSIAAPEYAFSVTGMYSAESGVIKANARAAAVSPLAAGNDLRKAEYRYAQSWYDSIMRDSFG